MRINFPPYLPTPKLTHMIGQKLIVAIAFLFILSFTNAQEKKDAKKWDVNNPEGVYKDVSFTTSEGTWMNVDVSPDGKEIVFVGCNGTYFSGLLCLNP